MQVRGGAQVVVGADQALADAVVDLAGDPAPFELLELDRAGREAFELGFPVRKAVEEHGVLDDPGEQPGDLAEARQVVLGEVLRRAGVHVQHADHRRWRP